MKPAQLRRAALALPEVVELETWGNATFRIRSKIICILSTDSASIKATPEAQGELLAAAPAVYSFAPYVGRFGWVAVNLAAADPGEISELLEDAWRLTAPKKLVRERDQAR